MGLALLFVTLPFVVRTVQPVLLELDPRWRRPHARSAPARRRSSDASSSRTSSPASSLASRSRSAGGRRDRRAGPRQGNLPYKTQVASVFIFLHIQSGDRAGASTIAVVLLAVRSLSCSWSAASGGSRRGTSVPSAVSRSAASRSVYLSRCWSARRDRGLAGVRPRRRPSGARRDSATVHAFEVTLRSRRSRCR